jgi:epoxide hydrolase 4
MATLDMTGVRDSYADLNNTRLHYVESGEGPLVVLLHGFPEFWFSWRFQVPALAAAGFRVVAPTCVATTSRRGPGAFPPMTLTV